MFRIKLLILLFSFFLFSCAKTSVDKNYDGFSVNYIGGAFDGLYLSNTLIANLKMRNMYKPQSKYTINASISHAGDVYITNVDKTSDRERIISTLTVAITDQKSKCLVYTYEDFEEQFYVIAPSIHFTSNTKAIDKIKMSNVDILVNNFLYEIKGKNFRCTLDNLNEYSNN